VLVAELSQDVPIPPTPPEAPVGLASESLRRRARFDNSQAALAERLYTDTGDAARRWTMRASRMTGCG
jgi:hypothetical protein